MTLFRVTSCISLGLLMACGKSPTAPHPVAPSPAVQGSCVLERLLPVQGTPLTAFVRVYYSVCPSDEAIAALGWTKVP